MKKAIYSFIAVAFAGLAWYCFSIAALNQASFVSNIWYVIGFLIAISIAYGLLFVVALNRDRLDLSITNLLCNLWLVLFLGTSLTTIISAAALFIATEVLIEFPGSLQNSINLRYFSTAYSKIALVALVLIGISAGYIQQNLNRTVSQVGFSFKASNSAWPIVKTYLNEFDSDQTVDQFIVAQLSEQGITNPPQSEIAEERQRLAAQFGVTVTGDEKMSDLGKIFLSDQIGTVLKKFNFDKTGLYIIFFSLLVLWPVWRMIFAAFAAGIYKLLRWTGQIKVVETQVAAQHLEF